MIDDSQYLPSHPSSLAFISLQDSAGTSGIEPMAAATEMTICKHEVRLSEKWLEKRGRDTDLKKGLDEATYCMQGPTFEARLKISPPAWWDHLTATGMDVRCEDYESKTCKSLIENPCWHPRHRSSIDNFPNDGLTTKCFHQDGLRNLVNSKKETIKARSSLLFRSVE